MNNEYMVSLNEVRKPRGRIANKSVTFLKKFVQKHTRKEPENIKVSNEVNEYIWSRSKQKKPKKFTIQLKEDGENVHVFLKEGTQLQEFENKRKAQKAEKKKEEITPEKKDEKSPEQVEAGKKLEEKKRMEEQAQKEAIKRGIE
ncbi:MAG: hypothetical protein HY393_03660 [Candidatus Diapherotrites archaeon]|nr:hypothetical protein [Candidatus Diapherotrites archaeon]